MQGCFVEMPAFERLRERYLDDAAYSRLQDLLLFEPELGDLIQGAGGLRKLRFRDSRRGKGKRGGLRVIYYYWSGKAEFWLFTVYDKNEMADLARGQKDKLREQLKAELRRRKLN
jgi:mRNA-degrading endonuclease RelE of RelBE toxin-antitoxin system